MIVQLDLQKKLKIRIKEKFINNFSIDDFSFLKKSQKEINTFFFKFANTNEAKQCLKKLEKVSVEKDLPITFSVIGIDFESDSFFKTVFEFPNVIYLNWSQLLLKVINNCIESKSGFYTIDSVTLFTDSVCIPDERIIYKSDLHYPVLVLDLVSNSKVYRVMLLD